MGTNVGAVLQGREECLIPAEGEVVAHYLKLREVRHLLQNCHRVQDALSLQEEDNQHRQAIGSQVVTPA